MPITDHNKTKRRRSRSYRLTPETVRRDWTQPSNPLQAPSPARGEYVDLVLGESTPRKVQDVNTVQLHRSSHLLAFIVPNMEYNCISHELLNNSRY